MKLSEFANVYKVSERHVRRLIKKYESDMVGHYEQRGNEGTFIDDVGVDILKSKLKAQFDVVKAEASEDEKRLNEQLILALAKCTTLAEQLADAEKRAGQNAAAVALLEAAKDNIEKLETRTSDAEERAARATERADQAERQATAAIQRKLEAEIAREEAEADRKQAIETLEGMRREAQFRAEAAVEAEEQRIEAEKRAQAAEDIAELNAQEAERAKAEAEDLKAKLEEIAAARGFKRRKLLKELKRRKKHE